ncbi:hypothetical protein E2C01_039304 [Portunus trituberculatus]|uniref:Uncharacterized protein n=1 Tax=Portunus trituberculatus TaxID=210409 RepID=A0A5B7FDA7_PORTR|nr:hypothetical protein [Portunus trituberculatus]
MERKKHGGGEDVALTVSSHWCCQAKWGASLLPATVFVVRHILRDVQQRFVSPAMYSQSLHYNVCTTYLP